MALWVSHFLSVGSISQLTRQFACRSRVVRVRDTAARVSFPFFNNRTLPGHGCTRQAREKKKSKNPNLNRCVLRSSLEPKISFLSLSRSLFFSQSHSLTPISSGSSSSSLFFFLPVWFKGVQVLRSITELSKYMGPTQIFLFGLIFILFFIT